MGVEAHPAADLEHEAVELVAQQEVAEVALGEGELLSPGQVDVDPPDGENRPVGAGSTTTGRVTPKWSATSSASRRPGYWVRASPFGTTMTASVRRSRSSM
jgi:hypothetical protein